MPPRLQALTQDQQDLAPGLPVWLAELELADILDQALPMLGDQAEADLLQLVTDADGTDRQTHDLECNGGIDVNLGLALDDLERIVAEGRTPREDADALAAELGFSMPAADATGGDASLQQIIADSEKQRSEWGGSLEELRGLIQDDAVMEAENLLPWAGILDEKDQTLAMWEEDELLEAEDTAPEPGPSMPAGETKTQEQLEADEALQALQQQVLEVDIPMTQDGEGDSEIEELEDASLILIQELEKELHCKVPASRALGQDDMDTAELFYDEHEAEAGQVQVEPAATHDAPVQAFSRCGDCVLFPGGHGWQCKNCREKDDKEMSLTEEPDPDIEQFQKLIVLGAEHPESLAELDEEEDDVDVCLAVPEPVRPEQLDEVTQMLKNTPPAPVTWLPAQLKDDKAATKEALQKEKAAAAAAKKLQKDADAEAKKLQKQAEADAKKLKKEAGGEAKKLQKEAEGEAKQLGKDASAARPARSGTGTKPRRRHVYVYIYTYIHIYI